MNKVRVTKQYRTETGHRLVNYEGKCAHLHGHSYLWEVTAEAPKLDERGMVVDFGDLKKAIKEAIEPLDHCMILSSEDPLVQMQYELLQRASSSKRQSVDEVKVWHSLRRGMLKAANGEPGRLLVMDFNPTAENLARWAAGMLNYELCTRMGLQHVEVVEVRVWETATSCAVWQKGLKED